MEALSRKGAAPKGLERIDHYIDSVDEGIRLHVREKRPGGKKKFEDAATLLIVHGRMAPGPAAYDLPVPGYSWMETTSPRAGSTSSRSRFGDLANPPGRRRCSGVQKAGLPPYRAGWP